jgi:hypothetical protein
MSGIITPETRGFSFADYMKRMGRRTLNRFGRAWKMKGRILFEDRAMQTVATDSNIHPIVKLWGDGYARYAQPGDKVEVWYHWDPQYGGRWFGKRI